MGKIKTICLLLVIITNSKNIAQENRISEGLLKAHLTLSPSKMLSENSSHFYLHGGLSYFVSPKISLDGEGYYFLGSFSDEKQFKYNHDLFFGAARHFTKNNNDLYIGLQPGVSFTKLIELPTESTKNGVNPIASAVVGYNFFVNKYFHFFIQSRFITGKHNYDVTTSLNEFRFSAGLGLNLNTKKKSS